MSKDKSKIQLSDSFGYGRLIRFVVPSIVMMVFISVYGVVDGLFVSNFVGKTAFAAVNLIMPLNMIFGGVGFMLGTGGSALVAKTLGEGDGENAKKYFSMMIAVTVLLGVILTAAGVSVMRSASLWLGADDGMLPYCVLYGRIVLAFTVSFMLQNVFQAFLITAEKPELGLKATVAAGLTNMALDALFVAGFKWGAAGAAVATGMSQCVGAAIPLVYFIRKNESPLRIVKTRIKAKPVIEACANGSSEMVTNITSSLVGMLYNFQLLKYSGENGVAAYGVLMYVQFIFAAVFIGYSIGSAPIISYHYGAKNQDELKNLLKKSVFLMAAAGILMTAAAQLLAKPMSAVFVGYDEELFTMTVHAMRISAFAFMLSGLNIFASSFFTALNNGVVSAAISFLRVFVFKLSAVLILPVLLNLDGIWLADLTAEVFALAVSLTFIFTMKQKYNYM